MKEAIHTVENFVPKKQQERPRCRGGGSAAGACIDHILFKIKILRNL